MTNTGTLTGGFTGFPPEFFNFLGGLEANNSKAYWEANRSTYQDVVQGTIQDLMADLEPDFGPLRTFRPNRDVRFSADKSPYKTWVGVTTSERAVGGIGSFLRLEAAGMRLACGAMVFAPDQVKRFRQAIDNASSGLEFEKIRKQLKGHALEVGPGRAPVLHRPPTGFSTDRPASEEFLRWKGAVVVKEYQKAGWMGKRGSADRIRAVWSAAAPLKEWIDRYVGESAAPASRRPR